jgi:hypothetical protein
LEEKTRSKGIYHAFKEYASDTKLPLLKLVSISTDGAPAMVGSSNGFV